MMTSLPHSPITLAGVLYCCPRPSPPLPSCTPGVMCTRPRLHSAVHSAGRTEINPMTKSGCLAAMATAASVYAPAAMVPSEDISASSSRPRPLGRPTCLRPSMMPAPGTMCALVMWLQSAMRCTPLEYCPTTVLPMSANLRSSKIRKLCLAASASSLLPKAWSKSGYRSQCVLSTQISGPIWSASASSSAAVSTSAATHRLVFLVSMRFHRSLAHWF
mmetsp:Transcript_39014/g.96672  ORF Transcript_39014/g.96672 Transcript_39014/m.96672 type:complete len:217 (+) Transcript_39014:362-1012(+)